MPQLDLRTMLCPDAEPADGNGDGRPLEVFDLFCGAGGFSEGARQAGCVVAFACDSDPEAIRVHGLNHPDTVHWCCALPRDDLPFPTDGRKFHVHGSPPCQALSTVGTTTAEDEEEAVRLVEWFLLTVLQCGASSWSMEQVASPRVLRVLEQFRARNRNRVAFAVFDLHDLGVPQHRKRVLAGPPALVARLLRLRGRHLHTSIAASVPVLRGEFIRNSTWNTHRRPRCSNDPVGRLGGSKYVYSRCTENLTNYPVSGPAPTVLASRGSMSWVSMRDGQPVTTGMQPCDVAALQTFPATYRFEASRECTFRAIGNAVPPVVAKHVCEQAAR